MLKNVNMTNFYETTKPQISPKSDTLTMYINKVMHSYPEMPAYLRKK